MIKIKKQKNKKRIKILTTKKLLKKTIRIEKKKNEMLTIRRLSNDDVKMLIKSIEIKNKLKKNDELSKFIIIFIHVMKSFFEMMTHDMRVVDVNTINQQKTIQKIINQNKTLHFHLQITRIT